MLLAESTPISAADTAESVHDRLADLGARLIVSTLDGLLRRSIEPVDQPAEGVEVCVLDVRLVAPEPRFLRGDENDRSRGPHEGEVLADQGLGLGHRHVLHDVREEHGVEPLWRGVLGVPELVGVEAVGQQVHQAAIELVDPRQRD